MLFNGEDHFDACGEVGWLAATDLDEIVGNLNLDWPDWPDIARPW